MSMAYQPTFTIHLRQMVWKHEKNTTYMLYHRFCCFEDQPGMKSWCVPTHQSEGSFDQNHLIRDHSQSWLWVKWPWIYLTIMIIQNHTLQNYCCFIISEWNSNHHIWSLFWIMPPPTAPSKQIPAFSLDCLLGRKAEGWETSKIEAVETDFFLKTNLLKISTVSEGNSLRMTPALAPLHHSNFQSFKNPETATRMPNSGDNMDNLSR